MFSQQPWIMAEATLAYGVGERPQSTLTTLQFCSRGCGQEMDAASKSHWMHGTWCGRHLHCCCIHFVLIPCYGFHTNSLSQGFVIWFFFIVVVLLGISFLILSKVVIGFSAVSELTGSLQLVAILGWGITYPTLGGYQFTFEQVSLFKEKKKNLLVPNK